jgi:hypothetical protein
MFRRREDGSRECSQPENGRNEDSGKDMQARVAQLRGLPRDKLADAVFMLSIEAKQQSALIRQALKERIGAELAFDPSPNADLATYLAEEAVSTLRPHAVDLPTLLDLLVQRSPDVRFTVHQKECDARRDDPGTTPRRHSGGSQTRWPTERALKGPSCQGPFVAARQVLAEKTIAKRYLDGATPCPCRKPNPAGK